MKYKFKNKPVIFQDKNFQVVQVMVIFPFKRKEDEIALSSILPRMLNNVNNKYKNEDQYRIESQKRYILANYCMCSRIGDLSYYLFELDIPQQEILNMDLYDEQFKFFSNMIYNPKVSKNRFYEEELEREIENIEVDIKHCLDDNVSYAYLKSKEAIDDKGILSASLFNHTDLIKNVNTSNLYEFYLDKIYNNKPIVYVMGNVDSNIINKLCDKYIYRNKFNDSYIDVNIKNYLKVRNKVTDIVEDSHFRDSVLLYMYKVKDMSLEDEKYIHVVKSLLSSLSSRLLMKKLRDENELVYSARSFSYGDFGIFGIQATINKNNEKLVREKIQEVIDEIHDVDKISPLLENIKERNRINLIKNLDNMHSVFHNSIIKETGIDLTDEEYYQELLKVTPADIVSFLDRLVLDTTYFLREGEHE